MKKVLKILEFDKILEKLQGYTESEPVKKIVIDSFTRSSYSYFRELQTKNSVRKEKSFALFLEGKDDEYLRCKIMM